MKNLLKAIFVILVFCRFDFAQPSDRKIDNLNTKGLALSVTFFKGRPPAYIAYYEKTGGFGKAWYALFRRIPNFQISPNSLPVRAVNIIPRLDKDSVRVSVSVFTGQKMHEKEEPIGDYILKEDDRIFVDGLTDFGVEPFELSLVWFNQTKSTLSTVVNLTNSLQVERIEPIISTLPSYIVHFLNNSQKSILAFTLEVMVGEQRRLSAMPQGKSGRFLIEPGETYRQEIQFTLQNAKAEEGKSPPLEPEQTLVIKSVIFADGSYQGNAGDAARFLNFTVGRRIVFQQLLKLIKQFEGVESFAKQIDNLIIIIDEKLIAAESARLKVPISRNSVEVSIYGERLDFWREFEQIKNKNEDEVRSWLNKKEKEYQNNLGKLP